MFHQLLLRRIGDSLDLYRGDALNQSMVRRIHAYLIYTLTRDLAFAPKLKDSLTITVLAMNNGTAIAVDYYYTERSDQYRLLIQFSLDRLNRVMFDVRHFPFLEVEAGRHYGQR